MWRETELWYLNGYVYERCGGSAEVWLTAALVGDHRLIGGGASFGIRGVLDGMRGNGEQSVLGNNVWATSLLL